MYNYFLFFSVWAIQLQVFHVFFACPVRNVSTLYLYMHVSRSDALSILGTLRMSYIRLVRKSHRIQLLLPVWCHLWNVNGTDNEYRGCMHFSGQVSIKFFKGGEMSYNTTSTFFKWCEKDFDWLESICQSEQFLFRLISIVFVKNLDTLS